MEINMQDILELDTETLVELRDRVSAEVDNRKFHDELKNVIMNILIIFHLHLRMYGMLHIIEGVKKTNLVK